MRSIIRSLLHFIIIIVSFYLAFVVRGYTDLIPFTQLHIPVLNVSETMLYGLLCAFLFVIIGISYHLYPIKKITYSYSRTFVDTSIIWLVFITFLAYFGNGFLFGYGISRLVIVFGFMMSVVLMFLLDTLYDGLLPFGKQTVLIIKNSEHETVSQSLIEFEHIHEIIVDYQTGLDIKTLINEIKPSSVLVVGDIPYEELQYIADKVTIAGVDMMHISEGMLLDDLDFQITRLGPVLGLQYRSHRITERDAVIKRIIDIIGSSLGLIILSPVMICTIIAMKCFDSGPLFFRHQRVGKNRVLFDYIKFRSMKTEFCTGEYFGTPDSERYRKTLQKSKLNTRKGELQKIDNDPRITPIGTFIRKRSIDELPSLRCILKGDMSLVGPRPHLPFEVERYQPWMKRLLSVKPGMTCYSQIYGRDRLPFADEAKFDIYYIQNQSVGFDIYILISTLKVLFKGR
ncbi:MAG TPA: sugar transferase [Candidatus Absconditabacterales bacterium]|nr:sugar transferase [Candidatus Absconditabacterales bacterium]HNG97148.1 sugar transferase [Candidatus Absconditabacterales bacterium]